MPGVLTHVGIMFAGILISFVIFKKLRYGIAFAIGHGIIDFIALLVTGVGYGNISFYKIMDHKLFYVIGGYLHQYPLWLIIAAIIQAIITVLYFIRIKKRRVIRKDQLIMLTIMNVSFLAGVFLHVHLDRIIFEKSIWV